MTAATGQRSRDDRYERPSRLGQTAAWVGIVADVVFVVAVIFFSGVVLGWSRTGRYGWHRGGWFDGNRRQDGHVPDDELGLHDATRRHEPDGADGSKSVTGSERTWHAPPLASASDTKTCHPATVLGCPGAVLA